MINFHPFKHKWYLFYNHIQMSIKDWFLNDARERIQTAHKRSKTRDRIDLKWKHKDQGPKFGN